MAVGGSKMFDRGTNDYCRLKMMHRSIFALVQCESIHVPIALVLHARCL